MADDTDHSGVPDEPPSMPDPPMHEEWDGVETWSKGYCGTYIDDCYPDDGWFRWNERTWSNRRRRGESMRESAIRKTERLAEGLARRTNGESLTNPP